MDSEKVDSQSVEIENPFSEPQVHYFDQEPARPAWVPDVESEHCLKCKLRFNFVKRRHHCRGCGQIFCHSCCKKWITLPERFGYEEPQRTCQKCFQQYNSIDFSRSYDVVGPSSPDTETIILLHGSLMNRSFFVNQVELLKEKYRCISVDLPAHGSRSHEILTVESSIQAVKRVVEAEILLGHKAIIFGHSLGGYVALLFAQRYADLCKALILASCSQIQTGKSFRFYWGAMSALCAALPESLLWSVIPTLYSAIPLESFRAPILQSGVNYDAFHQIADVIVQKENFFEDCLAHFDGPVLLINGEDEMRNSDIKLKELCLKGELYTIQGGTQLSLIDPAKKDEFNRVIWHFLESLHPQHSTDLQ